MFFSLSLIEQLLILAIAFPIVIVLGKIIIDYHVSKL